NVAGWNNTDVIVSWNWSDADGSADIDTTNCTQSSTSSGEGSISLSATCKDLDGNQGSASYTVKGDKTPPVGSVTGGSPGASYTRGSVRAAGCSTNDALSGVAPNAAVSVSGGTSSGVGSFTATCSGATDVAGNAAKQVSVSYTVGYRFSGFQSPV